MNFKQKLIFFACGCFFVVLAQIGLYLSSQWVVAQEQESETTTSIPQLMNYQGFLSEDGLQLNDTVLLTFTIYDAETGGTILWTETQPQVLVQNGLFNVILGSVESIPTSVFQQAERYLGIEVNGSGQELSPRQRLTSVAYAFNADSANYAANAAKLGGLDASSFVQGQINVQGQIKTGLLTLSESSEGYVAEVTGLGFRPRQITTTTIPEWMIGQGAAYGFSEGEDKNYSITNDDDGYISSSYLYHYGTPSGNYSRMKCTGFNSDGFTLHGEAGNSRFNSSRSAPFVVVWTAYP